MTSACVACKACWQWMPCAHGALSLPSLLSLAALQLLFEKSSCLNFHFKNLGIFMVSIEHYVQFYVDKTQNDNYPSTPRLVATTAPPAPSPASSSSSKRTSSAPRSTAPITGRRGATATTFTGTAQAPRSPSAQPSTAARGATRRRCPTHLHQAVHGVV